MNEEKCGYCPYRGRYICEGNGKHLTQWFTCPQERIRCKLKSERTESMAVFEHSIDPDKDFARWDAFCEAENARIRAEQEDEDE